MNKAQRICVMVGAVVLFLSGTATLAQPVATGEPVDEAVVERIRAEGLEHSQVMEILLHLTDLNGPRLTGSPELERAATWALQQLESWGLENVHREAWGPFGRGWTLNRFAMNVTAPTPFPVIAYPKAWSSGTGGTVRAEVVLFNPETEDDLARYEGRLAGKIVLMEPIREVEEPFEPLAVRRDDGDLLALANRTADDGRGRGNFRRGGNRQQQFQWQQKQLRFLYEARPLALIDRGSKGDYGTLFTSAAALPTPEDGDFSSRVRAWDPGGERPLPQVTMAVEHYNRIYRLLEQGLPVTAELDLDVTFDDTDPMEHNLIAEIPGADPGSGDELVMLGAHFDSWHAGTGATDNGAGSAVMMEAMRILQNVFKAAGTRPRRTIRLALWTGEEQGLLGSRAYVRQHFAESEGRGQPPKTFKPEYDRFSAYYNLDNGTGKIRGVYLQGNEAVAPLFRAWLAPFHDLGAATLSLANTGGTDHLSFDAVGLPGFQFIQEPMAYSTRTHHSNMDVYDHAVADDLRQAATIIAAFVYHTAQRDKKLPRKPLPEGATDGTR